MCWSLLLHSSGTREQNIGEFTEAQEAPGWLLVPSGGSFFFPLSVTDWSPDPPRTPAWDQRLHLLSKQRPCPALFPPPSVSPAACLHLRNCWDTLVWYSANLSAKSCMPCAEQRRYVFILYKVRLGHWGRGKASRFLAGLSWCVSCSLCICPVSY